MKIFIQILHSRDNVHSVGPKYSTMFSRWQLSINEPDLSAMPMSVVNISLETVKLALEASYLGVRE